MIYLLRMTMAALYWTIVVGLAVGAFTLVVTFVALIMTGMFADAFLESAVAGLKPLLSGKGLAKAARAFSAQFGKVSTRYSSWGHNSLRKAH